MIKNSLKNIVPSRSTSKVLITFCITSSSSTKDLKTFASYLAEMGPSFSALKDENSFLKSEISDSGIWRDKKSTFIAEDTENPALVPCQIGFLHRKTSK